MYERDSFLADVTELKQDHAQLLIVFLMFHTMKVQALLQDEQCSSRAALCSTEVNSLRKGVMLFRFALKVLCEVACNIKPQIWNPK